MTDLNRLHAILADCTAEYRKGAALTVNGEPTDSIERDNLPSGVVEIFAMPHVDEAPENLVRIDVVFEVIGVDPVKAEGHRAEFIRLLDDLADDVPLADGPSYMTVGAALDSQSAALQMFALGQVLGLWTVITPARFGVKDPAQALDMAGGGFIMMSGYRPKAVA